MEKESIFLRKGDFYKPIEVTLLDVVELKEGEGKPPMKFVDEKTKTAYRFTFDVNGSEKILDVSNSWIVNAMKTGGLQKDVKGTLQRFGKEDKWKWEFKPL